MNKKDRSAGSNTRPVAQEMPGFLGPPTKLNLNLAPGLEQLLQTLEANVAKELSPAKQIQASCDALQQIGDSAVGYFHAVFFFAALGHAWAIRTLAEFAVSATSAIEATIAHRPQEPMKPVPLWQSPEDRARNDAHILSADSPFAALLELFRGERQLPVLIRRHAKAYNARKLKLADIMQLGSNLNERAHRRRYPNPDKPLNRFLDRYLKIITKDPELEKKLPLLNSKSACRQWALLLLEIFEQHNGSATKHRLFAGVLKNGPPTEKGKRGVIRDAIQDALFRRHKPRRSSVS